MTAPPVAKEAGGGRPEHRVEEEQREPWGEEADDRPGEPAAESARQRFRRGQQRPAGPNSLSPINLGR